MIRRKTVEEDFTNILASRIILDKTSYQDGCDYKNIKATKPCLHMVSRESLAPLPIAMNQMTVVDEVPLLESNLITNQDDCLVECLIRVLPKKKKKRGIHSLSDFPDLSCAVLQKRQRTLDLDMTTSSNQVECSFAGSYTNQICFRTHQTTLWRQRFLDLCRFQRAHGHCLVPHNYKENRHLAKWVKRQRYQFKLKMDGRHSTLTDDRLTALTELGFIWDSHRAIWEERLNELRMFKEKYGHCNVPSTYQENHSLSVWVQYQRRNYKLYMKGMKPSNMNEGRVVMLDELGFIWDPRNLVRSKK